MREGFFRLIERVDDMAADAEVMPVAIGDVKALLEIVRTADSACGELDALRDELQVLRDANRALTERLESKPRTKAAGSGCKRCEVFQEREFAYQEQLRAANIRLEGAGQGAVKLAQGVANLVGSFLPADVSRPSDAEVARRLGVFVPGSNLAVPKRSSLNLLDQALERIPALPDEDES